MKTRRLSALLSSAALSSLVGLTLLFSSFPATGADGYEDGCYPPLSLACKSKPEVKVTPQPNFSARPTAKPVPFSEDTFKDLVKEFQNTRETPKAIQLSDKAKVGGTISTVAFYAFVNVLKQKAIIEAVADRPLQINLSGFGSRDRNYVQVFLSVSGKIGGVNLGRPVTADTIGASGSFNLLPITLELGARATFIIKEIVPESAYKDSLKGSPPTTFSYGGATRKLADYGSDGTGPITILRTTVQVEATKTLPPVPPKKTR